MSDELREKNARFLEGAGWLRWHESEGLERIIDRLQGIPPGRWVRVSLKPHPSALLEGMMEDICQQT